LPSWGEAAPNRLFQRFLKTDVTELTAVYALDSSLTGWESAHFGWNQRGNAWQNPAALNAVGSTYPLAFVMDGGALSWQF